MTEFQTIGPMPAIKNKKVTVSVTPIFLTYFAENQKATRQEITKAVFSVSSKLKGRNIWIDAIFRGNISTPSIGFIRSETVDEEIDYWLSNNFLRECTISPTDDLCFEVFGPTSFSDFKIEKLSDMLNEIEWNSVSEKQFFIQTLKEEFLSAKSC